MQIELVLHDSLASQEASWICVRSITMLYLVNEDVSKETATRQSFNLHKEPHDEFADFKQDRADSTSYLVIKAI